MPLCVGDGRVADEVRVRLGATPRGCCVVAWCDVTCAHAADSGRCHVFSPVLGLKKKGLWVDSSSADSQPSGRGM